MRAQAWLDLVLLCTTLWYSSLLLSKSFSLLQLMASRSLNSRAIERSLQLPLHSDNPDNQRAGVRLTFFCYANGFQTMISCSAPGLMLRSTLFSQSPFITQCLTLGLGFPWKLWPLNTCAPLYCQKTAPEVHFSTEEKSYPSPYFITTWSHAKILSLRSIQPGSCYINFPPESMY